MQHCKRDECTRTESMSVGYGCQESLVEIDLCTSVCYSILCFTFSLEMTTFSLNNGLHGYDTILNMFFLYTLLNLLSLSLSLYIYIYICKREIKNIFML